MNELEKTIADLQAKMDAASKAGESIAEMKAQMEALKKELAEKNDSIEALDKSAKEQKAAMDKLTAALNEKNEGRKTFAQKLADAIEEVKGLAVKAKEEGKQQISVKIKSNPAAIGTSNVNPNVVLGVQTDPAIHAAHVAPNAAIEALGVAVSEGDKLQWVEASRNGVVGYVEELASNTNLSDFSFAERTRKYGKLVTKIELSTEFSDWFRVLYDWCLNEARRLVEDKFDYEIINGAGNDTNKPTEIYGLKTYATAWSASGSVAAANIADVIYNAAHQIAKAGFTANIAFVTYDEYFLLRTAKDAVGHYLFNELTGYLGQVRIYPTTHLSAGEIIVLDSSCAQPYAGNSYEIEGVRDADTDKWKWYFRKRAQVKITTPGAAGIIYVASLDTAIAALTAETQLDGIAGSVADIAEAVEGLNADAKVFKTKEQTAEEE